MNEILKHISATINEKNNSALSDFEGYSPFEMGLLLNDPFGTESPFQLKSIADNNYSDIPLFNLLKFLLLEIKAEGEIKLTAKGFLPTKLVAKMYEQGFIRDAMIDQGYYKLYKEIDT